MKRLRLLARARRARRFREERDRHDAAMREAHARLLLVLATGTPAEVEQAAAAVEVRALQRRTAAYRMNSETIRARLLMDKGDE